MSTIRFCDGTTCKCKRSEKTRFFAIKKLLEKRYFTTEKELEIIARVMWHIGLDVDRDKFVELKKDIPLIPDDWSELKEDDELFKQWRDKMIHLPAKEQHKLIDLFMEDGVDRYNLFRLWLYVPHSRSRVLDILEKMEYDCPDLAFTEIFAVTTRNSSWSARKRKLVYKWYDLTMEHYNYPCELYRQMCHYYDFMIQRIKEEENG